MPAQDTTQIKDKMVSVIQSRGPSMPVHIANATGMSILFTSAFLSELVHEKKIKMSYMRIGSSPLYFLSEQEPQLENFSNYLKAKEREAFSILKEKIIINEEDLDPAIRVAIKGLKDFAIPLEKDGKKYWKYFLSKEEPQKQEILEKPKEIIEKEKPVEEIKPEKIETPIEKKQEVNIIKKSTKKPVKQKTQKQDSQFFNKVKEFLNKKSIEIIDIQGISKQELILKAKKEGSEMLIYALNKKKFDAEDIIKANKKATEQEISFSIISLGDTSKKVKEFLTAAKNLKDIEKLE